MSLSRPIKSTERVQQRYASVARGTYPVIVTDALTHTHVLDPSYAADSNGERVSFAVRHGIRELVSIGSVPNDLSGASITAGDPSGSNPAFLSIQTAGTDTTPDASLEMVERMRIGPGNEITLASNSLLDAGGSVTVREDITVQGSVYASKYTNLIDSHTSTSIFLPPTANALRSAYATLSNFIIASVSSGPSSVDPCSAPCLSADTNNCYETFAMHSIACTNIRVAGSISATSYCNLAQDHTVSDPRRPPSSAALNATYAQLSNYVTLKIDSVLWANRLAYLEGDASSNPVPVAGPATSFQSDYWVTTAGDGIGRLYFPSDGTQQPTLFGAVPAGSATLDAFRWHTLCNDPTNGGYHVAPPHMALAHDGRLTLYAAPDAPDADATAVLAPLELRLASSNSEAHLCGVLTVDGDVTFGSDLRVRDGSISTDSIQADDVAVASSLVVDGRVTIDWVNKTDVYAHLPAATASGAGMVILQSGGDDSNAAATTAYIAAVDRKNAEMADTANLLMGQAYVTAETAKSAADYASNSVNDLSQATAAIVREPTFAREYDQPDLVDAIDVANAARDGGVAIRMSGMDGEISASLALLPGDRSLMLSGPGPSALLMGASGGISIERFAGSSTVVDGTMASVIPTIAAQELATWTDPGIDVTYTALASSVFDGGAAYALPQNAFQAPDEETSWMSERGRYSESNGYPIVGIAEETVFLNRSADGSASTAVGEWIQLQMSQGVYATHFRLMVNNLNHVPDDFVLLGQSVEDAASGTWNLVGDRSYLGQASALIDANPAVGIAYALEPGWTQRKLVAIRLVVTRISVLGDSGYFSSLAQLGRLALEGGSFQAPAPQRIFTILNGMSMTVSLDGKTGFGLGSNALPQAPIHVRAPGASNCGACNVALLVSRADTGQTALALQVDDAAACGGETITTLRTGTSDRFRIVIGDDGDGAGADRVALSIEASNGEVSFGQAPTGGSNAVKMGIAGSTQIAGGDLLVDGGVSAGCNASFGGGVLTLRDSRVLDRKYANVGTYIRGARFDLSAFGSGADSNRAMVLREGYANDLSSLSLGTAGLMMIGDLQNSNGTMSASRVSDVYGGTGRDLLHQPTEVRWQGFLRPADSSNAGIRIEMVAVDDVSSPFRVVANDAVQFEWFGVSSNLLPAPDLLEPRGDDPSGGRIVLANAQDSVEIDLHDFFVDDAPDHVPWTDSRRTLGYQLLSDPDGYVVDSNDAALGRLLLRGKYADSSNLHLTVRAVSSASGRATDAALPIHDLGPPPPTIVHLLGVLDNPRGPFGYDLSRYFGDATLPSSGLTYSLDPPSDSNAVWSSAAVVSGSNLTILPDFRAERYRVAVRATSCNWPASTIAQELIVTELWPVAPRPAASLGSVFLMDNFTPVTYTIDPDGQPYFEDVAALGLVFSIECDVADAATLASSAPRGYSDLEAITWNRFDAFNGLSASSEPGGTRDALAYTYVPPPLPGAGETPAFSNEDPYWRAPDLDTQVLTLLGDFRDMTYSVALVATSVAYPKTLSVRRVLTVVEPPPPAPVLLTESEVGPVTLYDAVMEWSTDLRSHFHDASLRGLDFAVVDDLYGAASVVDGHTLRVVGAHRSAAYSVRVRATSVPYGVPSEALLVVNVVESDPPPRAAPPAPRVFKIGAERDDQTPLRIPLDGLTEALGALTYQVLSVSPTPYDSAYVDPGKDDLVVDGVNGANATYSVTLRATDAYAQTVDFDVVLQNIMPPYVIEPSATTVLMPGWPGQPLVIHTLSRFFVVHDDVDIVSYSIESEPCGCVSYDPALQRISVYAPPTVIRIYAHDQLSQRSLPYTINVPV